MSLKHGIYSIRNTVNNKRYIGSTCSSQGFISRWSVEKSQLNRGVFQSFHIQNAWKKYGKDNFEFTGLEECNDDMLTSREQSWIEYYKTLDRNFGYNLRPAARNSKYSEESKKRMSIAQKNRYINKPSPLKGRSLSEEHISKLSLSHIGHKHTDEQKRKISEAGKLRKHSEETKLKLSKIHTGIKHNEVTKEKMSKNYVYHTNGIKKHSQETLNKMSMARKGKPWTQKQIDASLKSRGVKC